MSIYSLDSLEEGCESENESGGSMWIERGLEALSSSRMNPGSGAVEAVETPKVVVNSDVQDKSMKAEKRNALIAQTEPLPLRSREVIRRRITLDESSTLDSKTTSNISKLKNDKKLNSVMPPKIVEAKTKPKTYLEQYHKRVGVPVTPGIYSPEGSALSIFGDSCREQISDVESHPSESTPRDDQSELSFYRRLINHPRTTRSWDVNERYIGSGNLKSVSDYGITMNDEHEASYRPYSIRDYECLTVSRADRSLGPDPVEIREKGEKLMRRTRYGDLASTRNRKNVIRRFELCKWKRTNVEKASGEFSLTIKDVGEGLDPESKNLNIEIKSPEINTAGLKKAPRILGPRRIGEAGTKSLRNIPTKFKTLGPSTRKTLIQSMEQGLGDTSLEDLQRRHQNEKRVVETLINRTLLR